MSRARPAYYERHCMQDKTGALQDQRGPDDHFPAGSNVNKIEYHCRKINEHYDRKKTVFHSVHDGPSPFASPGAEISLTAAENSSRKTKPPFTDEPYAVQVRS